MTTAFIPYYVEDIAAARSLPTGTFIIHSACETLTKTSDGSWTSSTGEPANVSEDSLLFLIVLVPVTIQSEEFRLNDNGINEFRYRTAWSRFEVRDLSE